MPADDEDESAPLSPRQAAFCREYVVDRNATHAAVRAGYSPNGAKVTGCRLLTRTNVQAEVARLTAEQSERLKVDADWVLRRLIENVERSMTGVPVTDREGNQTGVWTYQGTVANKSLELIGKHLGMFVERQEVTGRAGEPIEVKSRVAVEPLPDKSALLAYLRDLGLPCPGDVPGHGGGQPVDRGNGA